MRNEEPSLDKIRGMIVKGGGTAATISRGGQQALDPYRDDPGQAGRKDLALIMDFFTAYFWIAVCCNLVSRGEPQEGKIVVAHVIQNRALRRRLTVEQVIIQDKQFSCYNSGSRPPITNYDAFINCIRAVVGMAMQRLSGKNLSGADHYYSTDIDSPSWAKHPRMKFTVQIGKHRFFRWDG